MDDGDASIIHVYVCSDGTGGVQRTASGHDIDELHESVIDSGA